MLEAINVVAGLTNGTACTCNGVFFVGETVAILASPTTAKWERKCQKNSAKFY